MAVSKLGSEFTVGAKAGAPTAVRVRRLAARSGGPATAGAWAFGGLVVVGALAVALRRRRQRAL